MSVTVVWLDRQSKERRQTICANEKSARELGRRLIADGQSDVRYKPDGEHAWKAVRVKGAKAHRPKADTSFPPTPRAMKERHQREKNSSDALDRRVPGSFESR